MNLESGGPSLQVHFKVSVSDAPLLVCLGKSANRTSSKYALGTPAAPAKTASGSEAHSNDNLEDKLFMVSQSQSSCRQAKPSPVKVVTQRELT